MGEVDGEEREAKVRREAQSKCERSLGERERERERERKVTREI